MEKRTFEERQRVWRKIASNENAGIAARAIAMGFSGSDPEAYTVKGGDDEEKDNSQQSSTPAAEEDGAETESK